MSYWGCLEGFDFDGLTSLRCVTGYPLIELNIVYEQNSKKFLITRASLYILAFHSLICGWRVFHDTELRIDFGGYTAHQMEVPASYVGEPWKTLGLQSMITALTDMDSHDDKIASKACMVFAVHLCKACRIKFICLKIAQSIMPCVSTAQDLFQGEDQVLGTESCRDILPSLGPIIVDLNLVVDSDDQVVAFIKQFKQLCKAWMTYVLSRKSVCPLPENIADACGVKYVRTLRHSLSLLSNTNFRKILTEWEKKFHQRKSPTNFQQADLDFMRSMVLQFENSST